MPPDVSVLLPLQEDRATAESCIHAWVRDQRVARDRYELIVLAPGLNNSSQAGGGTYRKDLPDYLRGWGFVTGDPNGKSLPKWDAYNMKTNDGKAMVLGDTVEFGPGSDDLNLWEGPDDRRSIGMDSCAVTGRGRRVVDHEQGLRKPLA